MKCAQCENPSLKGIHTCQAGNPYNGQFANNQFSTGNFDARLEALRWLMSLDKIERDRVLRVLGA